MIAHLVSSLELLQIQRVDVGCDERLEAVVKELDILQGADLEKRGLSPLL